MFPERNRSSERSSVSCKDLKLRQLSNEHFFPEELRGMGSDESRGGWLGLHLRAVEMVVAMGDG